MGSVRSVFVLGAVEVHKVINADAEDVIGVVKKESERRWEIQLPNGFDNSLAKTLSRRGSDQSPNREIRFLWSTGNGLFSLPTLYCHLYLPSNFNSFYLAEFSF